MLVDQTTESRAALLTVFALQEQPQWGYYEESVASGAQVMF